MAEKIGIRPAAIVIEKGKLLLVKSEYNGEIFYLLPGGGMEFGETIEETAIRETLEETGMRIEVVKPVYINEYIDSKNKSKRVINLFFTSKIIGKDKSKVINDEGKIKGIEWIDLEDLGNITLKPEFLKQTLKRDLEDDFKNSIFYSVTFKNE
ncbi:MAG: NUDIX domain-containing protein [Candidatus Pacearchaeota archaeon]|nr:NUDIX domain-containing protein [Candidatus Pacearchaeota archaeon]